MKKNKKTKSLQDKIKNAKIQGPLSYELDKTVDWGSYDKNDKPVIDVDLSLCADEEKPRMIALINRLAKSPAGRETLEIAARNGYKFGFLEANADCYGVTCGEPLKAIGLKSCVSDDKLIGTLCHEARHAGQNGRAEDLPGRSKLNVASNIRIGRAMEADAQAYALKACKELEMMGDAGPLEKYKENSPRIYAAFEKEFEKQGMFNDAVLAAAFKGWYDQIETKQRYEEAYILSPMHSDIGRISRKRTQFLSTYAQNVTSEEVIKKAGWTNSGNYLAGEKPKFLDEERFLGLSERTKKDAEIFFRIREEKTALKPDTTLDDIRTYKDAIPCRLPEMGQADAQVDSFSLEPSKKRWSAILAKKGKSLYY